MTDRLHRLDDRRPAPLEHRPQVDAKGTVRLHGRILGHVAPHPARDQPGRYAWHAAGMYGHEPTRALAVRTILDIYGLPTA